MRKANVLSALAALLMLAACAPCDPDIGCLGSDVPGVTCSQHAGPGFEDVPHPYVGINQCAAACEEPQMCEAPGECMTMADGLQVCLAPCSMDADCPEGYFCNVVMPEPYCVSM